ncbi:hypothetical protein BSKO_07571 [Bryopsis sp. KO-2023]|nr:hypothetical protein BSKO_07571 [Bryopsis sp. KO-2023]
MDDQRFQASVAQLNAEFAQWVHKEILQNESCNLKQGAKEYVGKLERLERQRLSALCNGQPLQTCQYSLTPKQITKVVHLVRHGNGYHNPPHMRNIVDPHLTPLGWKQAHQVKNHLAKLGGKVSMEVVIVSPLIRTLETAVGIFGEMSFGNEGSVLMNARKETLERPAHPTAYKPPSLNFVAQEMCRETLTGNDCDIRRSISEQSQDFPGVDFSEVQNDLDVLGSKKPHNDKAGSRACNFLHYLFQRKETHLCVVTHAGFLCHILDEACKHLRGPIANTSTPVRAFRNCEFRTYVLTINDSGVLSGMPEGTWFIPGEKEGW